MSIARPDRAFFFVAAACALAYVSLPRDTAYYDRWYQLFPVAAVVATLIGVTIHKPRSKAPWYLVALSGLCAVTADALYAIELETVGRVPFPSTSDYFALGSYVVLAAALLVMIRKQVPGRDWPSLIDAGIVTVGIALVGWTFLVHPTLSDDSSALGTSVALAFPVMDILLVSLAARMVLGPGLRSPAFAMVATALVFQLAGDALYGFGSLHGWYRVGDSVDLFFVLAAVLWGTAALHPSMVQLTEPNPDPEQRLSGKRLAVLSAATLAAPAMLAVAAVREGSSELLVIVGAGAALGALVIVRLAGLVALHERSEQREHVLGSAAASLVSAWTREDIYVVAADAARDIVGQEDVAVELVADDVTVATAGAVAAADVVRTEVPLAVMGEDVALVVRTAERLSRQAREGVETLAAQVALALESANLAADLHERQSAERFRSLVQNSSDVIALLSPDLTIRYHTPSVERVLGYGEDELVGRRLTDLLRAGGRREARRVLRRGVRGARRSDAARPAAAPKGRQRRPARERLQQSSRRRERRRRGGDCERRHRAPRARRSAGSPGVPRFAHGSREPRPLLGADLARDRAGNAAAEPLRRPVHRSRRLQDGERQPRPRGRRRAARRRREPDSRRSSGRRTPVHVSAETSSP